MLRTSPMYGAGAGILWAVYMTVQPQPGLPVEKPRLVNAFLS